MSIIPKESTHYWAVEWAIYGTKNKPNWRRLNTKFNSHEEALEKARYEVDKNRENKIPDAPIMARCVFVEEIFTNPMTP